MGKTKTSVRKSSCKIKPGMGVDAYDPTSALLDEDRIGRAIWECLKEGDSEGVIEVIQIHLEAANKTQLAKKMQANMLHVMGENLSNLGHYLEALKQLKRALKIREETLPSDHPNVALSHSQVGTSLGTLERHQEALEHKQKALEILEKTLPPNHLDVAMGYNNLGRSLGSLRRRQEALGHFEKALEIWEKTLPPNHPDVARGHNNVGMSLGDLGRHQEALEHKQKALEIWKKALPPNRSNLVRSYNDVGMSLRDLGRHEEALEHMKQVLKILVSQKKHPVHERYLRNFILIIHEQPDTQLCENSKQEILALYTEKLGKDHELIKELNKACPKGWGWSFS